MRLLHWNPASIGRMLTTDACISGSKYTSWLEIHELGKMHGWLNFVELGIFARWHTSYAWQMRLTSGELAYLRVSLAKCLALQRDGGEIGKLEDKI